MVLQGRRDGAGNESGAWRVLAARREETENGFCAYPEGSYREGAKEQKRVSGGIERAGKKVWKERKSG